MNILVFGREGQLARALAEVLDGGAVTFAGRTDVDLAVVGTGEAAIAASRCDLVINVAAYTDVDQAEADRDSNRRLNAEAPGELARAAAKTGAPIVHVSTDYVFEGTKLGAYREEDATAPLGAYGAAKLMGETAVADANPRHLILRTAWLISPWGRNFVRTMIDAAALNDELRVVADQRGSPTSALDLARGIAAAVAALGRGATCWGTYHLAGSGTASWHDLAAATMEEANAHGLRSVPVQPIATKDWPTPAPRPVNSVLDSSRFERTFGYRMPYWRASLRSIVASIAAMAGEERPA